MLCARVPRVCVTLPPALSLPVGVVVPGHVLPQDTWAVSPATTISTGVPALSCCYCLVPVSHPLASAGTPSLSPCSPRPGAISALLMVWLDSDSRPYCASSRAATSGWLALYGGTGLSFFSAASRYALVSPLPWPALVCPSSSLSLPLHLLSLPSLSPVLCHATSRHSLAARVFIAETDPSHL